MAGVGAQNRDKTLFSSVTLVQSDTVPLVSWIVGPLGGGVGEGGEGSRGACRGGIPHLVRSTKSEHNEG